MSQAILGLTVATSVIGGLLFGYDIGVISGVLVMGPFKQTFKWESTFEEGFIASSLLLGCFIGSLLAAYMCDWLGRKRAILIGACVFCIGGVIQTASSTLAPLFVGRFVAGLAIGLLSMAVPLYLSEIAPKHLRGRLISMQQLAITVGILISFLINFACASIPSNSSWRIPLGIQVAISAVMVIGMIFLPASPRWLAAHGREADAAAALIRIRGGQRTVAIDEELEEIHNTVRLQREIGNGSLLEVLANGMWRRLGLGILLQIFQQFTGINAIMYYAPKILEKAGFEGLQSQLLATAGSGVINVLMTLPCIFLVDRLGRKPLLIAGSLVITATMAIFAAMVAVYGPKFTNLAAPYVCLVMLYFFIAGFAASWGPICWIIPAEIFPLRIRAKAIAVTTAANWLANFIVAQLVPVLMSTIGYGLFLIFAGFGLIMCVWVIFILPETKGKSLEEIDTMFGQAGVTNAREAELKKHMGPVGGH